MRIRLSQLPAIAAAIGLAASAGAVTAQPVDAPDAHLIVGVYSQADPATLEKAQWMWGGRNYCWYPNGWRGPGYYWCGYAFRRGFGWGGPAGWNGWRYDRGWRGDRGWHRGWDRRDHWRGDRGGGDRRDYPH
jgi:hypothetical protein